MDTQGNEQNLEKRKKFLRRIYYLAGEKQKTLFPRLMNQEYQDLRCELNATKV